MNMIDLILAELKSGFPIYFTCALLLCSIVVLLHGMHDLNKDDEKPTKKTKKHKKA